MALRLDRWLGIENGGRAEVWLRMQAGHDPAAAAKSAAPLLKKIKPVEPTRLAGRTRPLLACHSQQRLRIGAGDGEKRPSRAAGLLAALFPTLQCANRDTEKGRELALREPRLLARYCGSP